MMNTNLRRGVLFLLAGVVCWAAWWMPADGTAQLQVKADLERAAITFAAARALGAVLSVAQSATVQGGVVVAGVSISPGQALQPLNELVDHFATVMLAVSVAFGVQLFLLNVGAHWVVSTALTVVLALAIVWYWREDRARGPWLQSALVLLLLVRFAAPLGALANGVLYQHFMAHDYSTASAVMAQSEATVLDSTPEEAKKPGFIDRAKGWVQSVSNPQALYEAILKSGRDWSDRMVQLMTLFVLQTLLIPLGFLWLAWRVARAAVSGLARPAAAGERYLVSK